jgi:glucarate dehydratase
MGATVTGRIRELRATLVSVPLEAPLRWSMGVETATTRALIEVHTDQGVVGIGETYGAPGTEHGLALASALLTGLDPLEVGAVQHRLGVFRIGYETSIPATLRAGIEMACLDAAGKALGRPVHSLLGGKIRDRVEVAAYVFYRHRDPVSGLGGEGDPAAIVTRTEALVDAHGFRVIKLKGGVLPPECELQALLALRDRFPEAPLRWDPNAAWSVPTSLLVLERLRQERLALEYLEDPTAELEGMAQVRARSHLPLSTNMCLVAYEQLAPGIRLGAVDVILSDVHFWGGFRSNQKMMAVCEAFGLGVGMHSDRELGVSTAAMLHLAAASPQLSYAIDSHYPDQVGDVIAEPFQIRDGHMDVPSAPGLGVELDPEQVDRWHRVYLESGSANEFYDSVRPGWVPALPLW